MQRIVILLVAVAAFTGLAFAHNEEEATPIFVTGIPAGYRDWRLITVAHEAGNINDIRAILGNEAAITTYRAGELHLPDGAILARLAWTYVASEENNKAFGRAQSFVPGPVTNLQFMVRDSKRYAATGGWGFAQFDKDGKPAGEATLKTCFPCHQSIQSREYVFSHYAP